jgi:hypothetical protein
MGDQLTWKDLALAVVFWAVFKVSESGIGRGDSAGILVEQRVEVGIEHGQ